MTVYRCLNGTAMTAPARPTLSIPLITLDLPETQTNEVDSSVIGSTVKTSVACPMVTVGEITAEIEFDPTVTYPIGQTDESWKITLPLQTGQSTAFYKTFTGHIMSVTEPKATADGRATRTLKLKINSTATDTAAT